MAEFRLRPLRHVKFKVAPGEAVKDGLEQELEFKDSHIIPPPFFSGTTTLLILSGEIPTVNSPLVLCHPSKEVWGGFFAACLLKS